jgi:hypothetical protein
MIYNSVGTSTIGINTSSSKAVLTISTSSLNISSIHTDNGIYCGGNLTVAGTVSKVGGSFDIPHPIPAMASAGYHLRHCFVESPTRGDNLYRWQICMTSPMHIIPLPEYFRYLNENVQVWVNPVMHFGSGYGFYDDADNHIIIQASVIGRYNVLAVGTRKDESVMQWIPDNSAVVEYKK